MDKQPNKQEKISGNKCEVEDEDTENSVWLEDQKKRTYYYDDSSGYEIYNADEDDEEETL